MGIFRQEDSPGKWQPGDKIQNRYEVFYVFAGGFGVVYICYDHEFKVPVAIKGFKEEYALNETIIKLFEREAYEWTELERHQNIVRAKYVDKIEGRPYIFLEYISGKEKVGPSLTRWLRFGEINPKDLKLILSLATQIANGMACAYEKRNLIHRDLNPNNILITADGVAKVTDFGLAKAIGEAGGTSFISSPRKSPGSLLEGNVCGTPPYMPPEQWQGIDKTDTRSDIYSFGCILYEMLSGKPPFSFGGNLEQAHFNQRPQSLFSLNSEIPKELDSLILKCLEKNPKNRYQDFESLRGEVAEIYENHFQEKLTLEQSQPLEIWELGNKGASLTNLGMHKEAINCFDRVLELGKGSQYLAGIWVLKGNALTNLGRDQDAVVCYDKALEMNPESYEAWNNKGWVLRVLGRYKEAITCCDKALDMKPKSYHPWHNKATVLVNLKRYQDAITHFDKALEIAEEPSSWSGKGAVLQILGKFEETIECCNRALKINPMQGEAWFTKAQALLALGKEEDAINCLEKCKEVASFQRPLPSEVRDLLQLFEGKKDEIQADKLIHKGVTLSKQGKYQEAIGCYDNALKIYPKHAGAWSNKGDDLIELGRYQEAITCCEKALEINAEMAEAWNNKGRALSNLGRHQEALACYDKALEINPQLAMAWANKSTCHMGLGQFKETLHCAEKALSIDQANFIAWYNKGVACMNFGDYEKGITAFQRVIKINPGIPSLQTSALQCLNYCQSKL